MVIDIAVHIFWRVPGVRAKVIRGRAVDWGGLGCGRQGWQGWYGGR